MSYSESIQALKQQSRPRASHYHHHVWLGLMLFIWNVVLASCQMWKYAHLPNSSHFCLSVHRIIFQKSKTLDIFWLIWDGPWCLFWWAELFTHELHWGWWDLQCFKCCSGFFCGLLDESLMLSWNNYLFLNRNGFVSLYRLKSMKVSHLLWNFFRSEHDVLLLEILQHASCQTRFKKFLGSGSNQDWV